MGAKATDFERLCGLMELRTSPREANISVGGGQGVIVYGESGTLAANPEVWQAAIEWLSLSLRGGLDPYGSGGWFNRHVSQCGVFRGTLVFPASPYGLMLSRRLFRETLPGGLAAAACGREVRMVNPERTHEDHASAGGHAAAADAPEADANARDASADERAASADLSRLLADARGAEADLRGVAEDARTVAADARKAEAEAREASADARRAAADIRELLADAAGLARRLEELMCAADERTLDAGIRT